VKVTDGSHRCHLQQAFLRLLVDKMGSGLVGAIVPENPGGQVFDQSLSGGV
jgi:hypothetical protein